MHELSIAMEILDIVDGEAQKAGASKVTLVKLQIGSLSGVETDSLSFCFDTIKGEKKVLSDAELVIDEIPIRAHCSPCDKDFSGEGHLLRCPACEGFQTKLLQGDELKVVEIEVD